MRRLGALLAVTVIVLSGPAGAALAAPVASVSFTQAQQQFMCTVCHEPLNVARSPEAYNENDELRLLIRQGKTMSQVKRGMIAQYGDAVLADPPAHGFNLLVFVIPAR